ncbi:MAG: hypothetical protein CSA70_09555 [Rhodobacterales bacterium]|nr:MAG: hypothetical protein CSA70_09555 [Rhodobacterales bacterium]
MQVNFHAGVHCTDDDRLLKCLLKNRDTFAEVGTQVPAPGRYRKLLHRTLSVLTKTDPAPDAREILIDAILDGNEPDRLLLSNPNLFGQPSLALRKNQYYHKAEARVDALKRLFKGDQIELFIGLRNPASFLPALFEVAKHTSFLEMTDGIDPRELRWSMLILRLREAHPEIPITTWSNEDTPLIWAQIIREMGGLDPNQKIKGGFDLLSEIMTAEGMSRFRAYLAEHPVMTEIQKRRVMIAFLDKFAREDAIEEEFDLPGWTAELIEELTDIYDEDVYELSRIPGVTYITT